MAENGTLSVGIIGCGFFSPNHLHSWLGLPGVKVAAICDHSSERLDAATEIIGNDATRFSDADALLASGLCDFADIIAPPSTHHDLVLLAARRKVPAIIQKPMALSLDDAAEMVEAMHAANVPLMVHENFRFQGPIMEVRRLIDEGRIGAPVYARIGFRTGWDIYAKQPYLLTEKRFVIADLGVHVLDVARFLLGEADRITCEARSIKPGIAGEDMASMLLHHTSGATSVVECSYASPSPIDCFPQTLISVEGTSGGIVLAPNYEISVRSGADVQSWNAEPPRLKWAETPWQVVQGSVRETQAHWLKSFRDGTEPSTSGRDNLSTMRLVEAAYRSIETCSLVKL